MIKKLLTDHGRQVIATDFEIGAISGSHEDGTDREINLGHISELATMIADQASDEEAYRRGRGSAVAAVGVVAMVGLVVSAYIWAEKTGRIDTIPAGTRADFSMQQGPSIPVEASTQISPTDIPSIVQIDQ